MLDKIKELEEKIKALEARVIDGNETKNLVTSEIKKKWKILPQAEQLFGMMTALCVETIDPWKQNRVRYFTPLFHKPDTEIKKLPFANPISSMGGFDDSGLSWVPPAGSTICVLFESGNKSAPYYIGTTWHRDRGPDGKHNWGFNIKEYYEIHEGHRKGYLVGPDNGSQVFPPWNTESYNGIDIDSMADFENDPEAKKLITYPHIYGFKTPQKHMMKMVDGNYKCNHKHKRIEILSSCGNYLLFKDDHIHDSNWIQGSEDSKNCKEEKTECVEEKRKSNGNKYFKHKNEERPIKGPKTPENNKVELNQSGIQLLSISGHTIILDDSVEQPTEKPEWEKSLKDFDFGCTDKSLGKLSIKSATGHLIEISDKESNPSERGDENYIKLLTATGNKIELNDHTESGVAGKKRGITLQSTSNHTMEMIDELNEQSEEDRKSGGVPQAKAKKAFVKIRTGYGLEFLMSDFDGINEGEQENMKSQFIQIYAPQKNSPKGPHMIRLQEGTNEGVSGQLMISAGGDYICYSYDSHTTISGNKETNPSDIISISSKDTFALSEDFYMNMADIHAFIAKEMILLLAGEDCDQSNGGMGPCPAPVLVYGPKGVQISDRVYASTSKDAACVNIAMLVPFHKCEESN